MSFLVTQQLRQLAKAYLASVLRTEVVDEQILLLQQVGWLMEVFPCLIYQEVRHSCSHFNLQAAQET